MQMPVLALDSHMESQKRERLFLEGNWQLRLCVSRVSFSVYCALITLLFV